jgi:isorenieratene synthase
VVRGRAIVAWRDADRVHAAPEACPHLGASLAGAQVREGKLVCRWHGLTLGDEGHRGWMPLRCHDDGVLFWLRFDDEPGLTEAPILASRPARPLAAVIRLEAACDPRDVLANRLDPWHGTHYHPHTFGRLRVIERDERAITVRVAYRVLGRLAVEVDARFHCPEPHTIVMTIVRGEGEGSVVETHATPVRSGRTAILEATLATSERGGFRFAHALAPVLRPLIARVARKLWREDALYAERLYALRAWSIGARPPDRVEGAHVS